eukprot:COSAG06_NODE_1827_length_8276_cov_9.022991_2_plen_140_part_00
MSEETRGRTQNGAATAAEFDNGLPTTVTDALLEGDEDAERSGGAHTAHAVATTLLSPRGHGRQCGCITLLGCLMLCAVSHPFVHCRSETCTHGAGCMFSSALSELEGNQLARLKRPGRRTDALNRGTGTCAVEASHDAS